MKNKTTIILSALGLTLAAGLLAAAEAPAPAAPPAGREAMKARMAEKLGLTAEQQKKLDDLRAQMRAVLTPEQQQKVQAFRTQMHRRMAQAAQQRRGPGRVMPQAPGQPPHDPMAIVAAGERIKDQMAEKLGLSDEQRDKLDHLGRAYRAQQRDLAKKHAEEMRAVLTPEQQKKAEAFRKQHQRGPRPQFGPGGPGGHDGPPPPPHGEDEGDEDDEIE